MQSKTKLKVLILISLFILGCQPAKHYDYSDPYVATVRHLIVNGTEIDADIFPRTVALVAPERTYIFCTGTIISDDLIMTAAHCVTGVQGKKFYIMYGCKQLQGCNNLIGVQKLSIYPGYDKTKKHWNDIAILLLDRQVPLDTKIHTLHPSQYSELLKRGTEVIIAGYGRSSDKGAYGILRAGVTVVTKQYRNEIVLGRHMPEQSNICFGDSGSSFYIFHEGMKYVTGVASRLFTVSDEQICSGGSVYTLDGRYNRWMLDEYTNMLTDTLPETNYLKVNYSCNISGPTYRNSFQLCYIMIFFALFIRKMFRG